MYCFCLTSIVYLLTSESVSIMYMLEQLCKGSFYGNGTFWFMDVIIVLYVFVMSLARLGLSTVHLATILMISTIAWILLSAVVLRLPGYWYNSIALFPFGMLVAAKRIEIKCKPITYTLSFCAFFLLSVVFNTHVVPNWANSYAVLFFILSSIPFVLSLMSILKSIRINSRVLCYVGTNSYLFYMGHCIAGRYAYSIDNVIVSIILLFLITLIIIISYNKLCQRFQ